MPQQTLTDHEAAVLEDSAIRYKYSSHWGTEWEPTKDYLTWFEYSAVCRNGQVEIVAKGQLWKAPGLIKELSRNAPGLAGKRISLAEVVFQGYVWAGRKSRRRSYSNS